MDRAFPARLTVLCSDICRANSMFGRYRGTRPLRPGPAGSRAEERAELLQYASDTWRSFELLA